MDADERYLGYLKYSGKLVEDGLLDARKSAEALIGFDTILRYFITKENPILGKVDFEIPVRIQKGSWEIVIPEIIDKIFSPTGALSAAGAVYLTATANKAASEGLFSTGIAKDVKATFKIAMTSIQWIVKIATHLRTLTAQDVQAKINNSPHGVTIEISNSARETLVVSKKHFDLFMACPKNLFEKNAHLIEKERTLEIGVVDGSRIEKVQITEKEKSIYYVQSEDEEILFPELRHGERVELEGEITRGNEKTNTIGFEYQGHILTSRPKEGRIKDHKDTIVSQEKNHIFPHIKMMGTIDRTDQFGGHNDKRPQIIFSKIIPIESDEEGKQQELLL